MRKSKAFIFSLIISLIIAAIAVIDTIYCLANSYIIPGYLILFLVVAFVVSLLFVLIKKIPDVMRVVLSIILFLFTTAVFVFFTLFGQTIEFRALENKKEINNYYNENNRYDDDFDFGKFGKYESISNYKYHSMAIFSQEAYTTIAKYDDDNFDTEKSKIENSYKFYNTPVENEEAEPVFSYEGFDFKVEISDWYPKEMNLVGINEATNEIAFITFYDYDLDTIDDYKEFLDYYCGWRYIVKERN